MAAEFCVVCGRTDRPLTDGQCAECFADHHTLLTARSPSKLILCPTCGARKVGEHWERSGASSLLSAEDLAPFLEPDPEVAVRRVGWRESGKNPLLRDLSGEALVRVRGIERTVPVKLEVRIQHHTCPECSRRSGHFYTAILQLRGPEERIRGNARELRMRLAELWDAVIPEARPEWRRAMSWREERPEGWDVFLTDTIAARGLAKLAKTRLDARVKESASLYGRKDGQDLYRVTFCLRIPGAARAPPARREAKRSPPGSSRPRVER